MPRSTGIQSFSFRPHTHLAEKYKEYRNEVHNATQSLHTTPPNPKHKKKKK